MPSDKQRDSSRSNGAKSNGPHRRPQPLRDSLDPVLLARMLLIPGESRARFDNLVQALLTELQPASTVERMLVQKMIAAHWRQMRLWAAPTQTAPSTNGDLTLAMPQPPPLPASARPNEASYDRQFNRALAALRAVQSGRKMLFEGPNPGSD